MVVLYRNVELVVTATFNAACIISGCLTFGLTSVRTIVIYNPFYRIKQRLFVSCLIALLVVLIVSMQILAFWTFLLPQHFREFTICWVMTAILSCCNIVMSAATIIVLKKTRGDGQQERNRAMYVLLLSLSSLLNPLVYIFRKRQMRRFIIEQFLKLMSSC